MSDLCASCGDCGHSVHVHGLSGCKRCSCPGFKRRVAAPAPGPETSGPWHGDDGGVSVLRAELEEARAELAESYALGFRDALEAAAKAFEADFKCANHTREESLGSHLICAKPLSIAARIRSLSTPPTNGGGA